MAFTPKTWQNFPSVVTPLDAAALVDLETRVSAYTDLGIGNLTAQSFLLSSIGHFSVVPQKPVQYQLDGTADDAPALNSLLAAGNIHLSLYGTGNIGQALVLNSNTTLDLRNATLNMLATTNVDNIIRNSNFTSGNTNIAVIGSGHSTAILNGNTQLQSGENVSTLWKNVALLFVKVTGLTLRDFTLMDYSGWGISPQACTKVRVQDIQSIVNNVSYNQGLVNTADGGQDHIYANLTGNSHDDFVALVSRPNAGFSYSGAGGTLSRVVIRNLRGNNGQVGRMLRLLTGDGSQIFHVDVDGVIWEGAGVPADMVILDGSLNTDTPPGYLTTSRPTSSDFFDIALRNIKGGSQNTGAIINLATPTKQVRISGITATNAWSDVISIPSWGSIADLQVIGTQLSNAPSVSGDGFVIKNRGVVTNFTYNNSSGNAAPVSILDNTGGTITNFQSRNLNHPACSGPAITALGTMSNGPDYDWNLGGVAFRRRNNLNGRIQRVESASGDQTLNSATWLAIGSSGTFDITLSTYIGGWVEIGVILQVGNSTTQLFVDAATFISSTLTNFVSDSSAFSTGSTHGGFVSQPDALGTTHNLVASIPYQIQSADLVPLQTGDQFGLVTFRPVYRQSSATNQNLKRSIPPVIVWGRVLD